MAPDSDGIPIDRSKVLLLIDRQLVCGDDVSFVYC
jgi:hypothetical protein